VIPEGLNASEERALERAVGILESKSFVSRVFRSPVPPEQTIQDLLPRTSVHKIRANRHCSSIVIEYDREKPGILADLINRVRRARSVEDLSAASGGSGAVIEIPLNGLPPPVVKKSTRPAFPLGLPTASLILSFFAGPAVITVNVPLMIWNSRPILRRAWKVLRHERRLNVDFLDTLAISVSMMHGASTASPRW
jgi:Cu2+-exporting ATPase